VVARLSPPVQADPETHPAFYPMGTGSFPEVKQLGRGVDHSPPFITVIKERVELYLCPPLCFHGGLLCEL